MPTAPVTTIKVVARPRATPMLIANAGSRWRIVNSLASTYRPDLRLRRGPCKVPRQINVSATQYVARCGDGEGRIEAGPVAAPVPARRMSESGHF